MKDDVKRSIQNICFINIYLLISLNILEYHVVLSLLTQPHVIIRIRNHIKIRRVFISDSLELATSDTLHKQRV